MAWEAEPQEQCVTRRSLVTRMSEQSQRREAEHAPVNSFLNHRRVVWIDDSNADSWVDSFNGSGEETLLRVR